jgi:hypothetical protein
MHGYSRVHLIKFVLSMFALIVGLFYIVAEGKDAPQRDWELVRSVSNPYGGTVDLVLIPVSKQRDLKYYKRIGGIVCGTRAKCFVNFWTDRTHIPTRADMPVADLSVMTADYERSPAYKEPHLHLACWLYPNRTVGESMKCRYYPGAQRPPEK